MSRGCQLQGQLLPGQFINISDTLFVFCVTGIFLSLISTSEVDFCVWTSVLQKQKQTLPLSLLPSGPQFTEGPVQDPHFPELISAYVSHFPINLIHIFSAINSFEKETLPCLKISLYNAKMPECKNIHYSFLNSKQLEKVNAHVLGKLQNKDGPFTSWHLMQPL